MTVTVHLFARVRELAGADRVQLDVGTGSVADVRAAVAAWCPAAAGLVARSAVAVNGEYAADDSTVSAADEIALIPPVSGGGHP